MIDDLFVNVIDRDAAVRSINALLNDEPVFCAAALARLACGHLRPTNIRIEVGDPYPCFLCGSQPVVELELIEPTDFPHPDAFVSLPVRA